MFRFEDLSPSKALEYGTNMSCLDNQLYVCRAKSAVVINTDRNKIVLEPGDAVVCQNSYDDDEYNCRDGCIIVRSKNAVMKMESRYIMDYDMPDRLGYIPMMSIEDFRKEFHILNNETESLTECLRFAHDKNSDKKLKDAKEKWNSIWDMYNKKEDRRNFICHILIAIICLLITIGLIVFGASHRIISDDNPTGIQYLILIGTIMGTIIFGIISMMVVTAIITDNVIDIFSITKRPLQDEAEKEKNAVLNDLYLEIDDFRREHGWLSQSKPIYSDISYNDF